MEKEKEIEKLLNRYKTLTSSEEQLLWDLMETKDCYSTKGTNNVK